MLEAIYGAALIAPSSAPRLTLDHEALATLDELHPLPRAGSEVALQAICKVVHVTSEAGRNCVVLELDLSKTALDALEEKEPAPLSREAAGEKLYGRAR